MNKSNIAKELFTPIEEISKEVLNNLGIDKLVLFKVFNDNKYICCGNYPIGFFDEYLKFVTSPHPRVIETIQEAFIFNKGKIAWKGGNENDGNIVSNIAKKYGIGSTLTITLKDIDSYSIFCFVTNLEVGEREAYLLDHYDFLYEFCSIIRVRMEPIFSKAIQKNFQIYRNFTFPGNLENLLLNHKQNQMLELRKTLNLYQQHVIDDVLNLSNRELECIIGITKGKSYKEIGSDLSISCRTVETHINHIKEKTGLNSKSQIRQLFSEIRLMNNLDLSKNIAIDFLIKK